MKELSMDELKLVSGADGTDPNTQLIHDLGTNIAWGAGLGAAFGGGPTGALLGAVGGAVQTVGQGLIDHGPVNVPVPVLVGPSWNGSAPSGININGKKCPNGYRENPNGSCSP